MFGVCLLFHLCLISSVVISVEVTEKKMNSNATIRDKSSQQWSLGHKLYKRDTKRLKSSSNNSEGSDIAQQMALLDTQVAEGNLLKMRHVLGLRRHCLGLWRHLFRNNGDPSVFGRLRQSRVRDLIRNESLKKISNSIRFQRSKRSERNWDKELQLDEKVKGGRKLLEDKKVRVGNSFSDERTSTIAKELPGNNIIDIAINRSHSNIFSNRNGSASRDQNFVAKKRKSFVNGFRNSLLISSSFLLPKLPKSLVSMASSPKSSGLKSSYTKLSESSSSTSLLSSLPSNKVSVTPFMDVKDSKPPTSLLSKIGTSFKILQTQSPVTLELSTNQNLRWSGRRGCECWTSHDELGKEEVECCCRGISVQDIPNNLSRNVNRLLLEGVGIRVIRTGQLQRYSATLSSLVVDGAPSLHLIQSSALEGLTNLQVLELRHCPRLKSLPVDLLQESLSSLSIVRVIGTAVEQSPQLHQPDAMPNLFLIVDFEGNNLLRVISSRSIAVKANQLLLSYNGIETVEAMAFHGSKVAHLSLKGNKNLKHLHQHAFDGIMSLVELDLSYTSITSLPTLGLETLQSLSLRHTFTMKTFPSVFSFSNLRKAQLTYSYHCCAFQFPKIHDPVLYQQKQEEMKKLELEHCNPHATSPTPSLHFPHSNPSNGRSDGEWEQVVRVRRALGKMLPVMPSGGELSNFSSHRLSPGGYNYDMHPFRGEIIHQDPSSEDGSHSTSGHYDYGEGEGFHQNPAIPTNMSKFVCGDYTKFYEKVECTPSPDAFNPCEDLMSNTFLRVTVWVVIGAALMGNLAVIIVLMLSRFKMTVSKFLMCNLALADFCMGLYLLFIAVMDLRSTGEYFNHAIGWQKGYWCRAAGFLTVFSSELSIVTLVVITLERWYAITYAIHLNKRLRLHLARKIMALAWLYAATMATLPLLGVSDYSKTSICLPMEKKDVADILYLLTLLIANGAAFLLISVCYATMYASIKKNNINTCKSDTTVAKRMGLLVFTDFACWAPIAFFGLTAVAGYPLISVSNSKFLLVFFYPLNSCANPFLYAILTKQYHRDVLNCWERFCSCYKINSMSKNASTANHIAMQPLQLARDRRLSSLTRSESAESARRSSRRLIFSQDSSKEEGRGSLKSRKNLDKLQPVVEALSSSQDSSSGTDSPHPFKNCQAKGKFTPKQEAILERYTRQKVIDGVIAIDLTSCETKTKSLDRLVKLSGNITGGRVSPNVTIKYFPPDSPVTNSDYIDS